MGTIGAIASDAPGAKCRRRGSLAWLMAAACLLCARGPKVAAAEPLSRPEALAIVTARYAPGQPVKIETDSEDSDWISHFGIVAWVRPPAKVAKPQPGLTLSKRIQYPDSTDVAAQDLADEMKDKLYLMRVHVDPNSSAGTGGEMWFVGMKNDHAAVQREIDGARDVDTVASVQTSAGWCRAFAAAAKSTKSPSMVLALAGHDLIQPGMPDEQRMEVQRGLAELMFRGDAPESLRGQLSRWLGFLRVPKTLRLSFGRLMLAKCASALQEFSREPGKDSPFEFLILNNVGVLLRQKQLRTTAEYNDALTALGQYKDAWMAHGTNDRVRDAVLQAVGTIEWEIHGNL